jgi:hypothetical protein
MMSRSGLRRLIAACGVTAALAWAATTPVLAADHGAGARLHVTASFDATALGFEPCGLRVIASGTASGTRVGNSLWSQSECVDPFSDFPNVHVAGVGTITAADGDVLIVDYEAVTLPPDANNQIHPHGTFTIAGGTGRFAEATGGGSLAADGTANGSETVVFDGTIRLPTGG